MYINFMLETNTRQNEPVEGPSQLTLGLSRKNLLSNLDGSARVAHQTSNTPSL